MSDGDRVDCPDPGQRRGFELRRMTLSDLDQVIGIERESFVEPWTKANFEREVLSLDASEATVAVREDEVLGYTVAWYLPDKVHLANIAVKTGRRERGIGRALVEAVISRAGKCGGETVVLEVRESNHEARKLYDSLGFLAVGRRKNYYKRENEDAIIMQIVLGKTGGHGP